MIIRPVSMMDVVQLGKVNLNFTKVRPCFNRLLSFWHAGTDFATRKIATRLKPQKVIKQDGDCFTIKTFTTFRNYECSFKTGEEFKEVTKGMDNRSCQVKTEMWYCSCKVVRRCDHYHTTQENKCLFYINLHFFCGCTVIRNHIYV